MTRRLFASAALALALTTVPILADNPHNSGSSSFVVPITGTSASGPVSGTFTIKQFANINNTLNAVGTLKINNTVTSVAIPVTATNPTTALSAANANFGNSNQQVTPAAAGASCPVLHLVLGPLNLNLLGLNVSLNQVVLDITAIPGAGNLLGNLLCDVAGLLNGTGALGQLVNTLNQILSSL